MRTVTLNIPMPTLSRLRKAFRSPSFTPWWRARDREIDQRIAHLEREVETLSMILWQESVEADE